jgi:hypothetical protein
MRFVSLNIIQKKYLKIFGYTFLLKLLNEKYNIRNSVAIPETKKVILAPN